MNDAKQQAVRSADGPQVVVPLIGLPGAGKSLVAAHLAEHLGVRRLDRDLIRAGLFPVCNYTLAEKRAAFRALLVALEVNCVLGESSVIDGMTFARWRDVEKVDERARKFAAVVVPIWLDVPPHVARARVAEDRRRLAHLAADRDANIVNMVLSRFESPPPSVATIDASLPPEKVCTLAMSIVTRAAPFLAAARV